MDGKILLEERGNMAVLESGFEQAIFEGTDSYRNIERILKEAPCRKVLVVCGSSWKHSVLPDYFKKKKIDYCVYNGFQPNPTYENVLEGLEIFRENQCDFLISVGGGSAIDVAKCIKAYAGMEDSSEYICEEIKDNSIVHLAIPTTAGTGSESTHFAVMYYKGSKMSVSHICLLPEYVILEPSLLATLPDYQKKATLLDALCQATESYWSVKATAESRSYAKEAITVIFRYAKPYIQANENLIEIFHAANLAGRAINLTQTTLAHAMSYKLTSLYGIAHGHAVALCMPYVWQYLAEHTDSLQEGCRKEELEQTLQEINEIYHCKTTEGAISLFQGMIADFALNIPEYSSEDFAVLADSVNEQRMQNFPAHISKEELLQMYGRILRNTEDLSLRNRFIYRAECDMWELKSFSVFRQCLITPKMKEIKKGTRAAAVRTLFDAFWICENCGQTDIENVLHIVSELSIGLRGYLFGKRPDVINYENARKNLEQYQKPITIDEKKKIGQLQEAHKIVEDHAVILYRFLQLKDALSGNKEKASRLFGLYDKDINIGILHGILSEFGLLVTGNKECEMLNNQKDIDHSFRCLFYWKNAKDVFFDKKMQRYLTDLREVQLEMMDEIARVCKENNLTYVLNYGSLLGAVRHKGFIPWDDDMDICMPREDYEKFREIGKTQLRKGYYLYCSEDYPDCWSSIMKLMKKDTVFIRHGMEYESEDGQRIFIDIWPLDNVMGPAEKASAKIKAKKTRLTRILRLKIKEKTGGQLGREEKVKMLFYRFISAKWLIRTRYRTITKWKNEKTEYWMSGGVYNYIKETMPKAWYLPTTTVSFEGHDYQAPGNYEEVLKHLYGNYMQIPPLSLRYTHGPFKVQMKEGGEVRYFSETLHRNGKSIRFKLKRKTDRIFKNISKAIRPCRESVHAFAVQAAGAFRSMTANGRKLLSYKNKYQGDTCYVIADSNVLTEQDLAAMKGTRTFAGEINSLMLRKQKWAPDFYCISGLKWDQDIMPSIVAKSDKTQIFYTNAPQKGKKDMLKSGIHVAERRRGKAAAPGRMEKNYFNEGAGNLIFLVEMAVYMGFEKIIVLGMNNTYATYHMYHFADTKKLEKADRDYERYRIRMARYNVIKKALHGKCQIVEAERAANV